MNLPERRYYYIPELIKRWPCEAEDVHYCIEAGHLEVRIWLDNIPVEEIMIVAEPSGRLSKHAISCTRLNGNYSLYPEDCRKVLRRGDSRLKRVCHARPEHFYSVKESHQFPMMMTDLIILKEEARRFEKAHGLQSRKSSMPGPNNPVPEIRGTFDCSPDYHMVKLRGRTYYFGYMQSSVIKQLHQANKNGKPWCNGKTLLHKAGSSTLRLADLFKSQKDWRELVLSNKRGQYRLNISDGA